MSPYDKLKPYIKFVALFSGTGFIIGYNVSNTYKTIGNIINTNVLDREKKYSSEYIYIDDPSYDITLLKEHDKEKQAVGVARIWKSLKHSLAWRLLWLCRHGNREQRNVALEQLAAFKNNKDWDCLKLAQAFDMNTSVLLARTQGADLRYFLPPPIHVRRSAQSPEILSYKFRDMIFALQALHPHSCIQSFLSKNFANVQEQAMDADNIPLKPDRLSDHDLSILCLDALHHHLSVFDCDDSESLPALIKMDLLPCIAELFLRNPNDAELDFAILRVLIILSVDSKLLKDFFQNGLIRELARLIKSSDVRLSSSAAVCLSNLSGECCYKPGLYLLHPIYRTTQPQVCDLLLVHGLRGGVFVTWRQRDQKCIKTVAMGEEVVSVNECVPCKETTSGPYLGDPELREVIEELNEITDEALVSNMEIVLQDLPVKALREPADINAYVANKKRLALLHEEEDQCTYTSCWPKDWLPKDCNNLRILGVNYWTSLSEWLERCPLLIANIEQRANELAPILYDASVGTKNTPIVWVVHSMGGLIVKQLLVASAHNHDEKEKKLSTNTKAVVFFSTPHLGSAVASMPRAAAAILWPSTDVKQLQENSPVLLALHKSFVKTADERDWETICFSETKPTLVTAFKVPFHFVKPQSADLGRGVYYELPLDHLSICKPATRQSILYTTVLDVLLRVTMNGTKVRHSHSIFDSFATWLWWIFQRKAKEVMETIDETSSNDGLPWIERMLLETFSDGFSD